MLSVGVKSLEIYGCRSSLMKESCTQRYQDALQLYTNTESIDILTLSIAFMGLQHAGVRRTKEKTVFKCPLSVKFTPIPRLCLGTISGNKEIHSFIQVT